MDSSDYTDEILTVHGIPPGSSSIPCVIPRTGISRKNLY